MTTASCSPRAIESRGTGRYWRSESTFRPPSPRLIHMNAVSLGQWVRYQSGGGQIARSQRRRPAAATASIFSTVFITGSSVLVDQQELEATFLSNRNGLTHSGRGQGHVSHSRALGAEDLTVVSQLVDQGILSRRGEIDRLAGLTAASLPCRRTNHRDGNELLAVLVRRGSCRTNHLNAFVEIHDTQPGGNRRR